METTIERTPLLNHQIVNTLNRESLEDLISNLSEFSEEINNAFAGFLGENISEWYKAYLSSEEFAGLNNEQKKLSFDQYKNLSHIIKMISYYLQEQKLGIWNK